MKKMLMAVCVILTLIVNCACGEGLLPSLSGTIGVPMPSAAEALDCYPDQEVKNEDGSITEYYSNITETDFNTFSLYLEANEAVLADYNAVNGVLTAAIQAKGESFTIVYRPREESLEATYPKGTYDEKMKKVSADYDAAKEMLEKGDYEAAAALFIRMKGYRDVDSLLESEENLAAAAREAMLALYKTVGSVVNYGHYEQDNNTGNGQEDIEWIVLDVQEGKSLLLSKNLLDAKPYHEEYVAITWEDCSLRGWLNQDFMNQAFTKGEQSAILMTAVDNSSSQGYSVWSTDGGHNTQDKIFLLSYHEAFDQYFSSDDERKCCPTDYAVAQGAWTNDSYKKDDRATGWWWLRSPGYYQNYAAGVDRSGSRANGSVRGGSGCVRPAFWINLESDIF